MQVQFLAIVHMFQMQAMMALGKIMNPVTGAIERNLPFAKECIDILAVLEEKTKNNLTTDEERTLKHILQDLRLNYVTELERRDDTAAATGTTADTASAQAGTETARAAGEAPAGQTKATE